MITDRIGLHSVLLPLLIQLRGSRQRGRVVRELHLSCFTIGLSSTPRSCLLLANWFASCQLFFLDKHWSHLRQQWFHLRQQNLRQKNGTIDRCWPLITLHIVVDNLRTLPNDVEGRHISGDVSEWCTAIVRPIPPAQCPSPWSWKSERDDPNFDIHAYIILTSPD